MDWGIALLHDLLRPPSSSRGASISGSRRAATVVAISQGKRIAEVSECVCKEGDMIFRLIVRWPKLSIMVSAREAGERVGSISQGEHMYEIMTIA